ncbi:MAG: helix-turn-helix domain-containing protein [Patescibacteria group bacterium]
MDSLTINQAAELLGLSYDSTYKAVIRGVLRARRERGKEGRWIILRSSVERYRKNNLGKTGFASPRYPRSKR